MTLRIETHPDIATFVKAEIRAAERAGPAADQLEQATGSGVGCAARSGWRAGADRGGLGQQQDPLLICSHWNKAQLFKSLPLVTFQRSRML